MYVRFLLLLVIVLGLHLFLAFSVTRFFGVREKGFRRLVYRVFVYLFLSYAILNFAVRFAKNAVTSFLYMLSAFWLGFALYFLAAVVVCWIAWAIIYFARLKWPVRRVAFVLLLAAAAYSGYGVYNATTPVVNELTVPIKGLPKAWANKTIVQLSDVHLGAIYSPGDMLKFAKIVNGLKPDIIAITGDLFDGVGRDGLDEYVGPLKELKANKGVYFVNGNHEMFFGKAEVARIISKTGIRELDDEVVMLDGLQIIGVDFPDFGAVRDVKKIITGSKSYVKGAPTVLLYHTPTTFVQRSGSVAEQQNRTYWNPVTDFSDAIDIGVNLQLSGHTHKGQLVPFNLLTERIYGGYDYGLHRLGDFYIYTSCGLGTFGPIMRTSGVSEIVRIRLVESK